MSRSSRKLEMRWPLSSRTGRPPSRPRALPICGRERFEQFVDVGRAGRPDVAEVEHVLGRDVADHRAARALAGDDDFLVVANSSAGGGRRLGGGRVAAARRRRRHPGRRPARPWRKRARRRRAARYGKVCRSSPRGGAPSGEPRLTGRARSTKRRAAPTSGGTAGGSFEILSFSESIAEASREHQMCDSSDRGVAWRLRRPPPAPPASPPGRPGRSTMAPARSPTRARRSPGSSASTRHWDR